MNETSKNCFIHNVRLDSEFTTFANCTFEDENLSWAAKGLLTYILSREPGWKVHTWQLAAFYKGKARGNGIDSIRTYMNELKTHGYIIYQKTQDEEGRWQHNYFVYPMPFDKFQKMFPHRVKPDVAKPPVVKPRIITNTDIPSTELPKNNNSNRTPASQRKAPVAAVSSTISNNATTTIYPYLNNLNIPHSEKEWLTRNHSELDVAKAVDWATHPLTKIDKTLQQAIKWACKAKPEIPITKEDESATNKAYAKMLESRTAPPNNAIRFEAFNTTAEIIQNGNCAPMVFGYTEKGFKEKVTQALRKYGFRGLP